MVFHGGDMEFSGSKTRNHGSKKWNHGWQIHKTTTQKIQSWLAKHGAIL
jgi:hypothetical protein